MENNEAPKIIKQFMGTTCPHCKKIYWIGTQSLVNSVVSAVTFDDIKEVKNQIKNRLDEINFVDEADKLNVINYLEDENTVLDHSDIEPVLRQIAMEQVEKMSTKNKKI